MEKSLVSIIVPIYKVEQYLERCIKSIIRQSYTNIEIILVDDGSPDNCPQMCDSWAKVDSRIKVIHKKNGGLSDARNVGLKAAIGEFICFVDSDDYISVQFIETLLGLINRCHTNIASVRFQEVLENDYIESNDDNILSGNVIIFEGENAVKELFSNNTFSNYAWNKMYRRELFDDIEFPANRKMEDLGTTYKLLIKAQKIAFSTKPLYFYYQRDDSILHKPDINFYKDKFELSLERYHMIANMYPCMEENDKFFLEVILDTYPLLFNLYKGYDWKKDAKCAFNHCRAKIKWKTKIKYFIFDKSNYLYRHIQKK